MLFFSPQIVLLKDTKTLSFTKFYTILIVIGKFVSSLLHRDCHEPIKNLLKIQFIKISAKNMRKLHYSACLRSILLPRNVLEETNDKLFTRKSEADVL